MPIQRLLLRCFIHPQDSIFSKSLVHEKCRKLNYLFYSMKNVEDNFYRKPLRIAIMNGNYSCF